MVKRRSIIIHFRNPKAVKEIEKIVPVHYFHKRRRYAICYVNETEKESVIEEIKKMKLVKRVEDSLVVTDEYNIDFNVK